MRCGRECGCGGRGGESTLPFFVCFGGTVAYYAPVYGKSPPAGAAPIGAAPVWGSGRRHVDTQCGLWRERRDAYDTHNRDV